MSSDETFVLLVSLAVGGVGWGLMLMGLARLGEAARQARARRTLLLVLAGCGTALLLVLLRLAAHDVRDSPEYVLFYLLLGAAWLRAAAALLPWLGLSLRDDVVERGNAAALPAAAGWLAGMTLAFAGGNIGDGPGWWVVVGCALLSSGVLVLAWLLMQALADATEAVVVERDVAAGWRLGGLLLACGLIAGRAAAGNYVSLEATISDFVHHGWPVLPLLAFAIALQRALGPRPEPRQASLTVLGVTPALGYVAYAALTVALAGWPA
jgi:hypothetical protein